MACAAVYATAADFQTSFCNDVDLADAVQVTAIESALQLAAGDISMALAASGQCDCTNGAGAAAYLAKLNVMIAAVSLHCACGAQLSDDERTNGQLWIDNQLELLRTGKLTVCAGDTGSESAAFAWAEQALTDWSARDIVFNQILRKRG